MKINFPQITRRYTAVKKISLVIIILATLISGIVFNITSEYINKRKILGVQSVEGVRQENENQQKVWKEDLNYWLNFKQKYPDYNYTYLKLADLYSKLNQAEESQKMWLKYEKEKRRSGF
ncbi:hypothetical protein A3D78_07235 [Candidatus Gottesmanbacteria bacterium RIFCSPHIGHO2_02_FULL_39_14]|uniref:Uncharacterized protein n=1 Tax=Candidatus Gottesmanbacteria bacterium RIFCSPHIGHO2_02_FULL_39_14 TaxID=1798383 RepID=A0A1F5ZZL8_9BACT|nr:MAG: hypothetical protein A3D78_07235 [Candidatus Gottesmanbacteria bacterium RIFCSPHIGHO2_02_FULL_39_14]